jgi:hypothetical protein
MGPRRCASFPKTDRPQPEPASSGSEEVRRNTRGTLKLDPSRHRTELHANPAHGTSVRSTGWRESDYPSNPGSEFTDNTSTMSGNGHPKRAVGQRKSPIRGSLTSVWMGLVVAGVFVALGCSHEVPYACDETKPCLPRYPARPFCDVNGIYAESDYTGNTCIASPFDAAPTDAQPATGLQDLSFSSGVLEPSFSPDVRSYRLDVGLRTEQIVATPTALNATIRINGSQVDDGSPSPRFFSASDQTKSV